MTVTVSAIANCDDAVVFWKVDKALARCRGFAVEREQKRGTAASRAEDVQAGPRRARAPDPELPLGLSLALVRPRQQAHGRNPKAYLVENDAWQARHLKGAPKREIDFWTQ
jgi:hypothetical protein